MKLGTQVGLGPGHIVLDGDPVPPPPKVHSPNFRPIFIAGKRSPISATAECLLYYYLNVLRLLKTQISLGIGILVGLRA